MTMSATPNLAEALLAAGAPVPAPADEPRPVQTVKQTPYSEIETIKMHWINRLDEGVLIALLEPQRKERSDVVLIEN